MPALVFHDPTEATREIREQFASNERNVALMLGAGTSISVGLPGIDALTIDVESRLSGTEKRCFQELRDALSGKPNVEDVLNRVRITRELMDTGKSKEVEGLKESEAKALDAGICREICAIVQTDPPSGLEPHRRIANWLHSQHLNRQTAIEIFTTNYDLYIEKALEEVGVPFFDGFVGSVAPFFAPSSIDVEDSRSGDAMRIPRAWTRLWKLHGSISWRLRTTGSGTPPRIVRTANSADVSGELMIFPSREKYSDSRKLPFITYQDRFRKFLSSGKALLMTAGYSFSDQHINEIIFESLRSNGRLAVTALLFDDVPLVLSRAENHHNLTVYTRTKACIDGVVADWGTPSSLSEVALSWNDTEKKFTLPDFSHLASYLDQHVSFGTATPTP